jgi:hypothetical protein
MARTSALSVVVALAAASCLLNGACRLAFSVYSAVGVRHTPPLTVNGLQQKFGNVAEPLQASGAAGVACIAGAALGVLSGVSVLTSAAVRKARVAAKALPGAPSLIQVAEQKGLLSTVERLGLLSQAEKAGLGIETVEKLGLLSLAEDLSLLSLAEDVLTNGNTPFLLLAGAAALGGATFLDVTAAPFDLQWFFAGLLGAPALVLGVAGLAIFALFGGARRTRSLDREDKEISYTEAGFNVRPIQESVSLINVLEKKKILSFLEKNGLLSLAASVVKNPLTLTENLRVLSTLEKEGLLSAVESTATNPYGAASYGAIGAVFLTVAIAAALLLPDVGLLVALLAAVPGLAFLAIAIGLGIIQAPRRYTS